MPLAPPDAIDSQGFLRCCSSPGGAAARRPPGAAALGPRGCAAAARGHAAPARGGPRGRGAEGLQALPSWALTVSKGSKAAPMMFAVNSVLNLG